MPDTAPLIRPSAEADIAAITAIYGHAVSHGFASWEYDPPPAAEMAARRAALLEKGFPYLVAAEPGSGAVLGYAYCSQYRPRIGYRFVVEDSVYVAPEAQARGVGGALLAALLAALIEAAEALGARQMVAVIGGRQTLGSIRLHERMGFAQVGLLPAIGWKHGQWVDSVLMQRALGPGEATPPEG
ncbi:MAG: N-acetyltransferase [Alphaproteobacteria bacterium]|nr:N-acetyltransferase [Alphaproteobacteria bacterium]